LHWRAAGGYFFIADRRGTVHVLSTGRSGTTYVPAGRHEFAIGAIGRWTITIR
jgi:hypothetical protein